jgi:hypothetical protein
VREALPQVGDLTHDFDFDQQPRAPLLLPEHPSVSYAGRLHGRAGH